MNPRDRLAQTTETKLRKALMVAIAMMPTPTEDDVFSIVWPLIDDAINEAHNLGWEAGVDSITEAQTAGN